MLGQFFSPVSTNLEEFMQNRFGKVTTAMVVVGIAVAAGIRMQAQQTPAPPAAAAVEKPTYITIPMEIDVNKPVAEVWARVGKYCDIAEWLRIPTCTITAGKDNEIGAVRSVAAEVLVGKSQYSYTYTQTVYFQGRGNRPYNLYHGTLEARPVTATTSKLLYTLVFDNSMLADDAAREKDRMQKTAQFTTALQNMKILAEGGTLPPAPARGGRGF
jgi:hypothetical protein